jgi:flagellar biogenesis protein FliO
MSGTLTFIFAFVVVLGLIGLAAWLVRRFAGNRLGANTQRGRMPRLAVIDAAAVDGRRRLVLVRRDNIEHLLMIGGPTDIVVESNIVRATPGRDALPQRSAGAEAPPRIAPLPDAAWNDGDDAFPHPEPQMPEPPPRPARPAFADEMRRPSPPPMPMPAPERRADPLAGFAPEPMAREPRPEPRLERAEPRPDLRAEARAEPRAEPRELRGEPRELRGEPRLEPRPDPLPPRLPRGEPIMPRASRQNDAAKAPPMRMPDRSAAPPPPPPPPPPAPSAADQNLAEMAQRLEAALRRPAAAETMAPPVAPEPPPVRAMRAEQPAPPAPAPSAKSSFENLEDEMASLLGRPKSSSS